MIAPLWAVTIDRIQLSHGGIGTMLLVAVVAILLTGLFYYRSFAVLKRGQWQLLLTLRALAILIVVCLLFEPLAAYHEDLKEKRTLVFLVDRSRSMSIADDASGISRFQLARGQVEKWWDALKDDFNLHLHEFSEWSRPLEGIEQLASATPDGKATSISRALQAAGEKLPPKELEAVILLSDGINNTARSPLEITRRLGMVVHTVGVGASLRSNLTNRDIQVTGIDCPDRLLLNNKAKIAAAVEGIGLGGHVCKVVLEDNGQPIADQELTLDDIEGPQRVEFEILPSVKGRHTYTVRVPPAAAEKVAENNQRSAVALVIEPGIRVLYLEGTLRAEYGALVDRFLSKDPDLEFCALVQTRRNVFLRRTNMANLDFNAIPSTPEAINKFDVFILGDLDSSFIKPESQRLIVQRVQDGGGLVMLGGYYSLGPGGYEKTPLGDILPVQLGSREIGQVTDSFLPTLTPEGVHHAILSNVVHFFPTQQASPKRAGLPPLDGCTRVQAARPGASVLATYLSEKGAMPVLAVQPVAKGRSAVFTGDTTRKWQQGPRALDQDSPFLQFWGQMIRWAAGRTSDVKSEASLTASTDKGFYEPEEPIRIAAVVRDAKGEGTNKATIEAKITGPGGRPDKVVLSIVPGPEGHFGGVFEPKEAGTYQIALEAKIEDAALKCDPISVEVGRPNLEFEKLDLDEKTLQRIASDTGGRYVHISTADHLVNQLNRQWREKRNYKEQPLYWPSWFWAAFLSVLSAEWFLRKKFQLR